MYLRFYRLRRKPFDLAQDPGFFYRSRRHARALTLLEYGIENRSDICVVTGEVGSGKTMLVQTLIRGLERNVTAGVISSTHRSFGELLDWVLRAFRVAPAGESPWEKYSALEKFLLSQSRRRRHSILIVDEAQNLTAEQLEAVRVLSNVNAQHGRLILQLVLVGQPELRQVLQRPNLRQLAQRIAVDFHLAPMELDDVVAYIDHRMRIAGSRSNPFTREAARSIHGASRGVPRVVNILCDLALVYGYAEERKVIDRALIDEVVRDKGEGGFLDAGLQESSGDGPAGEA